MKDEGFVPRAWLKTFILHPSSFILVSMPIRPFAICLVLLCSLELRAAVPPAGDEARKLTHDIYQQLIGINTTESSGSCTAAAEAMATRLKAAGFPDEDVKVLVPADAP